MIKFLKHIIKKINSEKSDLSKSDRIKNYKNNGNVPWSYGYHDFKESVITQHINDDNFLENLSHKKSLEGYGYRLDERVIEYPWIFSKLRVENSKILDAGSTFNFEFIVNHPLIAQNSVTIYTYAPESNNFIDKGVSYLFGDLRELPFKDSWFDVVVSQSTIEHIDMDNSIYGYKTEHLKDAGKKSYEFVTAVKEMLRVLKSQGTLLLTFPFGKFENHDFFQQFDEEMLNVILDLLIDRGITEVTFFRYDNDSWNFAAKEELKSVVSYNPHTGRGKLNDGAAHCRSIACIHFIKN